MAGRNPNKHFLAKMRTETNSGILLYRIPSCIHITSHSASSLCYTVTDVMAGITSKEFMLLAKDCEIENLVELDTPSLKCKISFIFTHTLQIIMNDKYLENMWIVVRK